MNIKVKDLDFQIICYYCKEVIYKKYTICRKCFIENNEYSFYQNNYSSIRKFIFKNKLIEIGYYYSIKAIDIYMTITSLPLDGKLHNIKINNFMNVTHFREIMSLQPKIVYRTTIKDENIISKEFEFNMVNKVLLLNNVG